MLRPVRMRERRVEYMPLFEASSPLKRDTVPTANIYRRFREG
jgi:hypothetical protein